MPEKDENWQRDLERERRLLDEVVRDQLNRPPTYLVDMRTVYNGMPIRTQGQERLKGMWEKDPDRFLAQWRQAEREYRAGVEKGKREEVPEQVDDGGERAREVLGVFLEEIRAVKEQ